MVTWDTKVLTSQAVGRFPKREFDTMVLGMSKRVWLAQKATRIVKIGSVLGLREALKLDILIIGP